MPGLCFDRNNVVRSTREPPAAIWRDYAHKVRKNVNRARAAGLVCEADESGRELALFIDLYHRTLRRRDADPFYHFEREFFERLREGLAGQHAFFYVRRGRELLAAELVLVSADFVYSFLGGTDDVHFELRPNDLLKHSIIEWAHARGKRAFVLGGGAQPDDGIYRYKLSFAPRGRTPFFVSTRTLDEPSLQELLHRRTVAERSRGREWTPRHGFFPGYRG
jgi:predicted N-acyltransferase